MKIEYIKKNVYGNEMIYIKDEKISQIVRGITGKKTINQNDIDSLTKLGCSFNQVIA